MRWSTVNAPSEYGSAGAGQGTTPTPEKVFGLFRNAYTATVTVTAGTFVRGSPAILTAASASNNGYDVVNADTAGQTTNDLLVGVVFDYPDTSINRDGTWRMEDLGWVQVYGIHTAALLSVASTTIAANLMLVPDTASRFVTLARPYWDSGTAAAGTADVAAAGVMGHVYLYQTVATQAAGSQAVKVFIRCM